MRKTSCPVTTKVENSISHLHCPLVAGLGKFRGDRLITRWVIAKGVPADRGCPASLINGGKKGCSDDLFLRVQRIVASRLSE